MPVPTLLAMFRGAVRPPFIEAAGAVAAVSSSTRFGGQSAPPSLKLIDGRALLAPQFRFRGAVRPPFIEAMLLLRVMNIFLKVSGGSPPPLH